MTKSKMSEKIKQAIKESNYTQRELAALLGVDQTQISNYMRGKSKPSMDVFEKLLKILGKEANYFFDNSHISNSGNGDIVIGQNTIKKSSNNPADDYKLILNELRSLKEEIKKQKKSK